MALFGALFVAASGTDHNDSKMKNLGEMITEHPEVGDLGETAKSGRRGRTPSLRTRGRFFMSFRGGAAGGAGEELSEEFGETIQDQEVNQRKVGEQARKLEIVQVGLLKPLSILEWNLERKQPRLSGPQIQEEERADNI